ncbi:MAG: hypothetical protein HOP29_19060 [Phycisphaerales bacterium]|nr:hypothetical protein [Phycisphaerales bacterium]
MIYQNKNHVDLVNRQVGPFFGLIQRLLQDWIPLTIARFFDSSKTGKSDNLSLWQLLDVIAANENGAFLNEVRDMLMSANDQAWPVRDYRNKIVAHLDKAIVVATFNRTAVVMSVNVDSIVQAIHAIGEILGRIESEYRGRAEYSSSARTESIAMPLLNILGGKVPVTVPNA